MAYTVAVKVTWDRAKNLANQKNHGISFQEASELFTSGVDYLELFDDAHSDSPFAVLLDDTAPAAAAGKNIDGHSSLVAGWSC